MVKGQRSRPNVKVMFHSKISQKSLREFFSNLSQTLGLKLGWIDEILVFMSRGSIPCSWTQYLTWPWDLTISVMSLHRHAYCLKPYLFGEAYNCKTVILFRLEFLLSVLQVQPVLRSATTGSTGYLAVGLLAWPLEPHPDAPLWHHWQSQSSFQENAVKMMVRWYFFMYLSLQIIVLVIICNEPPLLTHIVVFPQ